MWSSFLKKQPSRAARFLLLLMILLAVVKELFIASTLSTSLSSLADPYSEANAIRAGENYSDNGFFSNAALPDVCYGGRFSHTGILSEQPAGTKNCVYTHYPPGPDLLTGAATKWFGKGQLVLFRTIPILIGALSLVFFAFCLAGAIGEARAALCVFLFLLIPLFTNMMHGLHQPGYALSFLLVEIGLLLKLHFGTASPGRCRLGLFLIAFVQGWFSFDYFFLVCLCPIPFLFLSGRWRQWRQSLPLVGLALAGWTSAHALHFLQLCLYEGGLSAALADMRAAAKFRGGYTELGILDVGKEVLRYMVRLSGRPQFFGVPLLAVLLLSVGLAYVRPGAPRVGRFQLEILAFSKAEYLGLVFSSLAVCLLWIVTMRNHAHIHGHFLPRHFFLFVFCLVTFWSLHLKPRISATS